MRKHTVAFGFASNPIENISSWLWFCWHPNTIAYFAIVLWHKRRKYMQIAVTASPKDKGNLDQKCHWCSWSSQSVYVTSRHRQVCWWGPHPWFDTEEENKRHCISDSLEKHNSRRRRRRGRRCRITKLQVFTAKASENCSPEHPRNYSEYLVEPCSKFSLRKLFRSPLEL